MRSEHPVRYATERLLLRLVFLALAVLFTLVALPWVWQLLSPFLIAVPAAAMLQPAIGFLQKRLRFKRGFAVAFWVFLVCAVAFVIIYWVISFLIVQIGNVVYNAQSITVSVTGFLQAAGDRVLNAAKAMPLNVGNAIRSSLDSAIKALGEGGMALAGGLSNLLLSFAASLPYALIYANFLVLGLFFITGRYPFVERYLRKSVDMDSGDGISLLRKSAVKGMLGYIRVQVIFSLVTLLLSWICFQFFGFPYAFLIAFIAAFMELIPQFGCGTLYLPWSIISFVVGHPREGWIVLGLYLVYQVIRRVAEPMLLGNNLGISPLLSLIGMFVGLQLGGIIGLILGPVVMVILASAVRAHLFDGIVADCSTLSSYMRRRWKRGQKKSP